MLASLHFLQLVVHHFRGDLAGAEKHFKAGLPFFDDPGFQAVPGTAVAAFACASSNVWMLGRADTARRRDAQMMATANASNAFDVALSRVLCSGPPG